MQLRDLAEREDLVQFRHADQIWRDFPNLVPCALAADGIASGVSASSRITRFTEVADRRLAAGPEGEFPEIQAWRRTFSVMGLKPTQYRCAAESLLRRYRKEGSLPQVHPLIDVCNAISLAFAIPVAVFDTSRIIGDLVVRYADGSERYLTFAGEEEHPQPHEVIFADAAGRAHARRWTNRQSSQSAVRDETTAVLIVAEGLHQTAPADVQRVMEAIAEEINALWQTTPTLALLSKSSRRFEFTAPNHQ